MKMSAAANQALLIALLSSITIRRISLIIRRLKGRRLGRSGRQAHQFAQERSDFLLRRGTGASAPAASSCRGRVGSATPFSATPRGLLAFCNVQRGQAILVGFVKFGAGLCQGSNDVE